jgi:hypothetical protein
VLLQQCHSPVLRGNIPPNITALPPPPLDPPERQRSATTDTNNAAVHAAVAANSDSGGGSAVSIVIKVHSTAIAMTVSCSGAVEINVRDTASASHATELNTVSSASDKMTCSPLFLKRKAKCISPNRPLEPATEEATVEEPSPKRRLQIDPPGYLWQNHSATSVVHRSSGSAAAPWVQSVDCRASCPCTATRLKGNSKCKQPCATQGLNEVFTTSAEFRETIGEELIHQECHCMHDSQTSGMRTSQQHQDSSEPDGRWIVHCGGGHDIEPGNMKYLERILLVQCDFMKADRASRQSLIDDCIRDF